MKTQWPALCWPPGVPGKIIERRIHSTGAPGLIWQDDRLRPAPGPRTNQKQPFDLTTLICKVW